mmetsp:Transcript_32184/g.73948  ORF Transcript_32184/g.73948 Transcript_32184/m.73948 type:complete len:120 (-) Transcript_32184:433-792(-)
MEEAGFRLLELCRDVSNDQILMLTFQADLNNGTMMQAQPAKTKTPAQQELLRLTQERLSRRNEIFGDRMIYGANAYDFLKARPETYQDGDKIHDYGQLLYGAHKTYVETLVYMRGSGGV